MFCVKILKGGLQMKFSENVLLEIVSIVRDGLVKSEDISEKLRNIDVAVDESGRVALSKLYLEEAGRAIPSKIVG
jgi:hypothetical protein